MAETKQLSEFFTPERMKALKKRLRSQRWHPAAVDREIALIQKLREQLASRS